MARSDPQTFTTRSDTTGSPTGVVRLENVALQRTFETDKAGLTSIDARIEAELVAPDGEYVTATIDLVFSLFHGDGQVASCQVRGIVFDGGGERSPVRIETDVARLGLDADITAIEVFVDKTSIVHAETKLRLDRV